MGTLAQDLRSSLRILARRAGPSMIVILTLALGIGLTSAVFSVVEAVLLRALPFPQPERLVAVSGVRRQGGEVKDWPVSYADFLDWRAGAHAFAGFAAHSDVRSFNLQTASDPEHLAGEMASAGYFEALGVAPAVGRGFTREEDDAVAPRPVAVLGYDLWRRRFNADRSVLGRPLVLDGLSYTVVGVAPRGFRGATDEAEVWLPLGLSGKVLGSQYTAKRRFRWLNGVGRLRPGATVVQAQRELDGLAAALERRFPDTNEGISARVAPLRDAWVGSLRGGLLILLGAAAFVLLIACTNVAALLVSLAVERQREISIRAALGAGRLRLVRQFLTESLVLAAIGCAAGLFLALWSVRLLAVTSALGLRRFVHIGLDPAVLGFTVAVALLCGLFVGLVPAWIASRADLGETLKEGGKQSSGSGRLRFQSSLVVVEVAFSLALLVAAILTIGGFRDLLNTPLGFRPGGVLALRVDVKDHRYREDQAFFTLVRQVVERGRALPGVHSLSASGPSLPTDSGDGAHCTIEDRHDPADDGNLLFWTHNVGPGYFSTLGTPIVQGREFTPGDVKGQPWVAVVSETAARKYWPGQSPLGRRITVGPRNTKFPWFTVVGVAADVRNLAPGAAEQEPVDLYFSLLQVPARLPPILSVVARPAAGLSPESLVAPLRRELRAIDPGLPPFDIVTLDERLSQQTARPRLVARLMGLFAALALTLAAVGIYGTMSYAATRRSREIGVRLALGGERGSVLRRLVWQGAGWTLAGIALGLLLALFLCRVLTGLLEGVKAVDPWIFAGASVLLLAVALLASLVPAWRASQVDPAVTLRAE